MGLVWGTINPLFMILTTSLIFSSILKADPFEYFVYVYAGMLGWLFINQSIFLSSNSILINESLLRKVKIDFYVFPIASVIAVFFDNIILFALYVIFNSVFASTLSMYSMLMLPAYVIIIVFCCGCSIFFSIFSVFFRDLQWLVSMVLQTLFFLTPVLYKPKSLTGIASTLVTFNPLSYFVELTNCILNGIAPPSSVWFVTSILATVTFVGAVYFYNKIQYKIVYRL